MTGLFRENQTDIQKNHSVKADLGRLRKNIRKAVVAMLKDKTAVGARVFPNASVPPWESELPVILVYQRSEPTTQLGQSPKELIRSLDLAIEIIAKGPEENVDLATPEAGVKSLEDTLDDIAEQVESELHADDTLQGTCDESELNNTEFEFESVGALPIGSARLTYTASYTTMVPRDTAKQDANDDFKTNQVDTNIGDDENTRESTDTVDLPTS